MSGMDRDREDLFALFLAALQAVVPEVTSEQRALVREVVDGLMREREVRVRARNA